MLPITPAILRDIHKHLDLSIPVIQAFWAAALCAFYSFFRKSTLLPMLNIHDCKTELCRKDVTFTPDGAEILVKQTKTLRFRDRILLVPIPKITGNILCPVLAMRELLLAAPNITSSAALFSYQTSTSHTFLTPSNFTKILRTVLTMCGYPASKYSPHSFRRGGASFAWSCGNSLSAIKAQGDWRSSSVEQYLPSSMALRHQLSKTLAKAI